MRGPSRATIFSSPKTVSAHECEASEPGPYCHFMGLVPTPRSTEHAEAFKKGLVNLNSYVEAENRHISPDTAANCRFAACSDELTIGIGIIGASASYRQTFLFC